MCLIVVGWRVHPDFPLVVAANRDEFYARPSAAAGRWPDDPRVLGGRDLEAGGTWLGMTESGRFAAVTNVREPAMPKGARSRGELTKGFLQGIESAGEYAANIDDKAYSGFNLLVGDGETLWYASNRDGATRALLPGVYGLSNHLLDTPWPKLVTARQRFAAALQSLPATEDFFAILADDQIVPDEHLPQTGVALEWERRLSAIFVRSENYGTRASTVLTRDSGGTIRLEERSFGPNGQPLQSSVISTGV
ncbi:MAG TPA: NRDE family protein [Rhodocyclaceae bacterium]|nr:NRDE family protein [Rhodocyclaceae bacterium]